MAFPSTPVLDTFNAGGSQLLTARTGWSASTLFSDASMTTDSVPTYAGRSGAFYCGNSWATVFAADQELYVKFGAVDVTNHIYLYTRLNIATTDSYYVQLWSNFVGIHSLVSSVDTTITSGSITPALQAGDSFGWSLRGTLIELFAKYGANSWTPIMNVTNAALNASGRLYAEISPSSAFTLDEFGGGAVIDSPSSMGGWAGSSMGDKTRGARFG